MDILGRMVIGVWHPVVDDLKESVDRVPDTGQFAQARCLAPHLSWAETVAKRGAWHAVG